MEFKHSEYGKESDEGFVPGIQPAVRRPLKIFAFDPSLRRATGNPAIAEVVNEELDPGPQGGLVRVVDYNGTRDEYYPPVDLDDPVALMQRGLDPSDSDPRFHQQMVYAVVMKVIENFERALGRPFRFRKGQRLTVLPTPSRGRTRSTTPRPCRCTSATSLRRRTTPAPTFPARRFHLPVLRHRGARNDPRDRGPPAREIQRSDQPRRAGLPRGGRRHRRDLPALHFPEVLQDQIRATRADLARPGRLLELAQQFGCAMGKGEALREATEPEGKAPDAGLYENVLEPHERGSMLVAAVFDAFFRIYRNRISGLVRAVTGGSGILPAGELQSDLVNLTTREASQAAQDVLTMCLRAFEYLPPVDVTFGDYLRAVVTADFELNPRDEHERRASFIDAFRLRGIYAPGVLSLAEEALRLDRPADVVGAKIPPDLVTKVLASQFVDSKISEGGSRPYWQLYDFARANAQDLQLTEDLIEDNTQLAGFHPSFHVDENGQLRVELVAQPALVRLEPAYDKLGWRSG
jgi:hypothetical protein